MVRMPRRANSVEARASNIVIYRDPQYIPQNDRIGFTRSRALLPDHTVIPNKIRIFCQWSGKLNTSGSAGIIYICMYTHIINTCRIHLEIIYKYHRKLQRTMVSVLEPWDR